MKLALKPFFKHGEIDKDDYKLIMRKSVEKVCVEKIIPDLPVDSHPQCEMGVDARLLFFIWVFRSPLREEMRTLTYCLDGLDLLDM